MKLEMPSIPKETPVEIVQWIEQVVQLVNQGFYAPKQFSAAPVLGDMKTGELAWGNATGGGGAHEVFIKLSDTVIGRWTHDATIT